MLAYVSLRAALRAPRFTSLRSVFWGVLISGIGGCAETHSDHPHEQEIGCQGDARALQYTPGLMVSGNSNALQFVLLDASPAPPAKDLNRWTVELLDTTGERVTDATLSIAPWMPDHGHGPSRVPTVTVESSSFVIDSIHLFMAGLWRVTLTASGGSAEDSAAFFFCVEG